MNRLVTRNCRLAGSRKPRGGTAAMEFALVAPIMVLLFMAAFDLGNAAQQLIVLNQAVRAGGVYANSFPTDTTGITNAVTNALPSDWAGSVTLNNPAMAACPGLAASLCITINASRANTPLLTTGIAAIDNLTTVTASYVSRFN
jgi:Flp pilus assembly protein TadG